MDKDNLLRRAHDALLLEHEAYSTEMGQSIGWKKKYHERTVLDLLACSVCDLLREIDESLESVDQVCDCHPGYWSGRPTD